MQAGDLVSGDVVTYVSRILVNGVQRYGEWSVDRELSGDLPAQVVAVSGITQATGSVNWFQEKDVVSRPLNPWNPVGWFPRRGDRVEVFVGDGTTEWKRFHGLVDKTTGDLEGGFQSTLIDDYDKLSAPVSHRAMLRIMPPEASDGSEPYRGVGLHPIYYVDYALRQAGFFCTPSREFDTALYVPLQGSAWPQYGSVSASTGHLNTITPWGFGVRGLTASYVPGSLRTMGGTVQVSLMVAPDHASSTDVYVDYGSAADHLRLTVDGSRVAIALKNGIEVCRVSLGSGTLVSMLAKSGTISLRTNLGATASGAFTASGVSMSAVRLNAGVSSSVAGLQVSHPAVATHDHASTKWVPSAVLDTSSVYLTGIMDAGPTIEDRAASGLLDEINNAVLSAMWIDETGVMRWANSDTLRERAPVRTVTTLDDIFSLEWEDGLLATASRVRVTGRKPAITKGRWKNLVLARGNGESMKSGDELTIFLEPEGDEDWIIPSLDFIEVGGSAGIWNSYNNPAYSAVGLYYSTDGGETTVSGLGTTITTEAIGLQKVLVKYMAGAWPSDVEGVVATSPVAGTLWPKNRNNDLPRLVGRGRVRWMDEAVSATGAGGPGPELVHDVGVWANRTDRTTMLDRYASYLQSQTAMPEPVITGMSIAPDPRLQLGDVVTVKSSLIGVSLDVLITSVSESFGSGGLAMDLGVRVISADVTGVTYEQFNGGGNLTYAQLNVLAPTPQTYGQFNADM